jgi:hypothetical protein
VQKRAPRAPEKQKAPECHPFQSKSMGADAAIHVHTIFFHPDCTVGLGISPNPALRLVGYTTGGELHPALKILIQLKKVYAHESSLSRGDVEPGSENAVSASCKEVACYECAY